MRSHYVNATFMEQDAYVLCKYVELHAVPRPGDLVTLKAVSGYWKVEWIEWPLVDEMHTNLNADVIIHMELMKRDT